MRLCLSFSRSLVCLSLMLQIASHRSFATPNLTSTSESDLECDKKEILSNPPEAQTI